MAGRGGAARLRPLTGRAPGAALFAQFSAHPADLPATLALQEARSTAQGPALDPLLRDLAHGPAQEGAPTGAIRRPFAIGWGRRDRVALPVQAERALQAFPDARLHWSDDCGHSPQWDRPEETVQLILDTVGR